MDNVQEDLGNAEEERTPSPTGVGGQPGKSGGKKVQKKKERGRRNREICDVFGDAGLSYNIVAKYLLYTDSRTVVIYRTQQWLMRTISATTFRTFSTAGAFHGIQDIRSD